MVLLAIRFRGVYLAVMAVPLFLSVTLILFLKVDLLTTDVSVAEFNNAVDSASYVSHVLRMQQGLNSIRHVAQNANSLLTFDCQQLNSIKTQPRNPSGGNHVNPISRHSGVFGLQKVQIVQSIPQNCKNDKSTEGICLIMTNYQILKEAVTLLQLSHSGLARLLGICSSIDQDNAMYITEAGLPVNMTYLKTLELTHQLQIVYHVVSLLGHLHNSSLGHLSLRSVNDNTFVWINGLVKLADISQLTTDNTACSRHSDCHVEDSNTGVKCLNGACLGLLNQINLRKAVNFLKPLFADTENRTENKRMNHIISQINHLNIDAVEAARQIKDLLNSVTLQQSQIKATRDNGRKGQNMLSPDLQNWQTKDTLYWPGGPDEYKFQRKMNRTISSSQHNYVCPRSLISWGCQLRVNTIKQALTHCTGDPQCRAFVLTQNDHQVGTLTLVLKSGHGDMLIKEGSSVFVKVPLGTETLHMSHEDDLRVNYQNDNPALCSPVINSSWKMDREERRISLMKLINMQGLTEAEWMETVKVGRISRILRAETNRRHAGLRTKAKLEGNDRTVVLNNGEKPSRSHLSHLLFYHLDSLLGIHRVVPTAFRSLDAQEVAMISNTSAEVKMQLENVLRGNASINVVITPDVEALSVSTKPLSIQPLQHFPKKVEALSSHERMQLEYLTLLWLSGTPRDHTYTSVNGKPLHLLNMDSFQQGVDNLLPYFNYCQFPKSLVEYLQTVTNSTRDSCSVASQLLHRLKQEGIEDRDILSGFHSAKHLMLLIDKAVEKLLEIMKKCLNVFGKEAVLY